MIKTLLCDIGNVLLFFSHDKGYAKVADLCGVPVNTLIDLLVTEHLHLRYETGQITTSGLCDALRAVAKKPLQNEALVDAWCDIFQANETIVPVIQQLKDNGIRLVLLSNISEMHHHYVMGRYSFLKWFDDAALSYKVGAMKPDDAIFHAAIEVANCAPAECFYIDDVGQYVAAARGWGIDAETYTDTPSLVEQLRRRGLFMVRG